MCFNVTQFINWLALTMLIASAGACGENDDQTKVVGIEGEYKVTVKAGDSDCSSDPGYHPKVVTLKRIVWTACSVESGDDCSKIYYNLSSSVLGYQSLSPRGNTEPALQIESQFTYTDDECISYEPNEPCPPKKADQTGSMSLKRADFYTGRWAGDYKNSKDNCISTGKIWLTKTD